MKFHKEITSKEFPIYDTTKAKKLYNGKNHRKLSLMKQENFRIALMKKQYYIKDTIAKHCGYCFKYWGKIRDISLCNSCPILKTNKKECFELPEWNKMMISSTYEELLENHKKWLKKIKLWKSDWE